MASNSPQLAPTRTARTAQEAPSGAGEAAPSPPRGSRHAGLRGKDLATQIQMLSPTAGVQRDADGTSTGDVHAAATRGIAGGGGALPHYQQIQQSFGRHDVTDVQAHVGGPAKEATAAMGATAYATGNHVAFGGSPDLHTAAHEAAHVVQQRAGVSLKGGVGQVGDTYERHADAVADRVVAGRSAEDLLDGATGGGHTVQRQANAQVVQRDADETPAAAPPTVAEVSNAISDPPFGWTSSYQVTITASEIQLLMRVRLVPAEGVTPEQIEDVQTRTREGVASYLDNKFTFTDTSSRTAYNLRVSVEFVETGEHLAVNLRPGNASSNLLNWSVERPTATFAHELGHQLGLKDEYIDGRVADRAEATSPGVHTDHSLMGNFHAEGHDEAVLHERHGATVAGHVGGATERTFSVTRR